MKIFKTIAAAALMTLTVLTGSYHAQARPDHIAEPERWIIRNDGGGNVMNFMESLDYMRKNNMAVKVGGYCASACTLILSTDYKIDVCLMPDVKFGFHQPYAMDGLGRIYYTIPFVVQAEKLWRELFYAKYPTFVQKMIDAHGGVPAVYKGRTPDSVLWLNYEDLKPFIKTCL